MRTDAEVRINDGAPVRGLLTVETETLTQTSSLDRFDPAWSTVDDSGHFHAAAKREDKHAGVDFPTLDVRVKHRVCDGSCGGGCGGEGYASEAYYCRLCWQKVKPGTISGLHTFTMQGRTSWQVEVYGGPELQSHQRELVTVRATSKLPDGPTWLGIAMGSNIRAEGGSGGIRLTLQLIGDGPLLPIGARVSTTT